MERINFKYIVLFLIWGFFAQDILARLYDLMNRLIEFFVISYELDIAEYRLIWLLTNVIVSILFITALAMQISVKRDSKLMLRKIPKLVFLTVISAVILRSILYVVYMQEWNNFNFYLYLSESQEIGKTYLVIIPELMTAAPTMLYSLVFILLVLIINRRLKRENAL